MKLLKDTQLKLDSYKILLTMRPSWRKKYWWRKNKKLRPKREKPFYLMRPCLRD